MDPRVIVCAWCGQTLGNTVAVRPAGEHLWETLSREFAGALKRAGFASHGVCPDCRLRVLAVIDGEAGAAGAAEAPVRDGSSTRTDNGADASGPKTRRRPPARRQGKA